MSRSSIVRPLAAFVLVGGVACSTSDLVVLGDGGDGVPDASFAADGATGDSAAPRDGSLADATGAGYAACSTSGQCILATGCCGESCGVGSLAEYTPVNRAQLAAHQAATCGGEIACPACVPSPTKHTASYVATCRAGTCSGVDVRVDAVSICGADDDCMVRANVCCECGAPVNPYRDLVAVAKDRTAAFAELVCSPTEACARCAPVYPSNVKARCRQNHCVTEVVDGG
ncbi:MAG: hypothetical protein U0169_20260 [Polyangiaceae bacterium]